MLKNWGFSRRNAPFYVWMVRYYTKDIDIWIEIFYPFILIEA